jgi:PPOX class probable F420-dependent enzyme
MIELNENVLKKLREPNFAYLATIMPDGSPQVSPMWVDVEDGYILFNTQIGRRKEKNMRRDPRVAITVPDRENLYDKVEVRGRVVEFIEGPPAFAHIDKMAQKYINEETYPWLQPGDERVIIRVEPDTLFEGA